MTISTVDFFHLFGIRLLSGHQAIAQDGLPQMPLRAGNIAIVAFQAGVFVVRFDEGVALDEPAALDWDLLLDHLKALKEGSAVEMPTYSYLTCTRQKETEHLDPHEVVLLEGILVLSDKRLRNMMDIKVFVDADGDDRLIRVISRDCIERGRTPQMVIDRYERVLKPMHLKHIEPAKRFADLIVPQGGHNEVAINLLTDYIMGRINNK